MVAARDLANAFAFVSRAEVDGIICQDHSERLSDATLVTEADVADAMDEPERAVVLVRGACKHHQYLESI